MGNTSVGDFIGNMMTRSIQHIVGKWLPGREMGFFEHREWWIYCASDWGTKQTTVCCYSGDILGYTAKFGVPCFWPRPFFPYKHVFKRILGISASRLFALENQLHGDNACPIAGEVYGIPFSPRPTGENLQDPAANCFFSQFAVGPPDIFLIFLLVSQIFHRRWVNYLCVFWISLWIYQERTSSFKPESAMLLFLCSCYSSCKRIPYSNSTEILHTLHVLNCPTREQVWVYTLWHKI